MLNHFINLKYLLNFKFLYNNCNYYNILEYKVCMLILKEYKVCIIIKIKKPPKKKIQLKSFPYKDNYLLVKIFEISKINFIVIYFF